LPITVMIGRQSEPLVFDPDAL